ncbi:MAG: TFIIB-type zinc ribbon-containing protein [Thermaceae bacterium]
MVCPVCGEILELEEARPGDILDCEACGATLKAVPSSQGQMRLEVVAFPEEGFAPLEGLTAFGEGEGVLLDFGEESVWVDRSELAEALIRLEEGMGEEPPKEAEDEPNLEPDYASVEAAAKEGPLLLRRIFFQGAPDLLEFTLPSGAVYTFPFREAFAYLRPFLR